MASLSEDSDWHRFEHGALCYYWNDETDFYTLAQPASITDSSKADDDDDGVEKGVALFERTYARLQASGGSYVGADSPEPVEPAEQQMGTPGKWHAPAAADRSLAGSSASGQLRSDSGGGGEGLQGWLLARGWEGYLEGFADEGFENWAHVSQLEAPDLEYDLHWVPSAQHRSEILREATRFMRPSAAGGRSGGRSEITVQEDKSIEPKHLAPATSEPDAAVAPIERAAFNLLDFEDRSLRPDVRGVHAHCQAVVERFGLSRGFQEDTRRNVVEHLVFLLVNAESRRKAGADAAAEGGTSPLGQLHNKTFDNYKKWCAHLGQNPQLFLNDGGLEQSVRQGLSTAIGAEKFSAEVLRKLADVACWLLIYSEAGNLRFCPELLCFLYHRLRADDVDRSSSNGRWFVSDVVTPIYKLLKMRMNGADDLDAHNDRQNYDDVNEFFWREECLKLTDLASLTQVWAQTKVEPGSDGGGEQTTVVDVKSNTKTFMERRSFAAIYRNFGRVYNLNFVLFWLLSWSALTRYARSDDPAHSAFFTMAGPRYVKQNHYLNSDHNVVAVLSLAFVVNSLFSLLHELVTMLEDGVLLFREGHRWKLMSYAVRLLLKSTWLGLLGFTYFIDIMDGDSKGVACPNCDNLEKHIVGYYPDWLDPRVKGSFNLSIPIPGGLPFPCKSTPKNTSSMPRPAHTSNSSAWWDPLADVHTAQVKLEPYYAVCCLRLLLELWGFVLSMFPKLRVWRQWKGLWFLWAENASYVGKDVAMPVSIALWNVLFWVAFFAAKLTVDWTFLFGSDYFIQSTFVLWNEGDGWLAGMPCTLPENETLPSLCDACAGHNAWEQYRAQHKIAHSTNLTCANPYMVTDAASGGLLRPMSYIAVATTWVPFLMVFLVNNQIFFVLTQMVVGFGIGWYRRVGKIESWASLERFFCYSLPERFNERLMTKADMHIVEEQDADADAELHGLTGLNGMPRPGSPFVSSPAMSNDRGSMNAALLPGGSGAGEKTKQKSCRNCWSSQQLETSWRVKYGYFARAWNTIIERLRYSDLVSNEEVRTLSFTRGVSKNSHAEIVDALDRDVYLPFFITRGLLETLMLKTEKLLSSCPEDPSAEQLARLDKEALALADRAGNERTFAAVVEVVDFSVWLVGTVSGNRQFRKLAVKVRDLSTRPLTAYLRGKHNPSVDELNKLEAQICSLANLLGSIHPDLSYNCDKDPSTGHFKVSSHAVEVRFNFRKQLRNLRKEISRGETDGSTTDEEYVKPEEGVRSAKRRLDKHVGDIRAEVRNILTQLKCCFVELAADVDNVIGSAEFERNISSHSIADLLFGNESDRRISCTVINHLHLQLSAEAVNTRPSVSEARRRLKSFAESLFMEQPTPVSLEAMNSWSCLTPYYKEDVTYSSDALNKGGDAEGVSNLYYLQRMFPDEWSNWKERHGLSALMDEDVQVKIDENLEGTAVQAKGAKLLDESQRIWASNRGQTLSRTVRGMVINADSLRLLGQMPLDVAGLGSPSAQAAAEQKKAELDLTVTLKFQYVVSCQVYAAMRSGDASDRGKARSIDALMQQHPMLRVAYIDKEPSADGRTDFFSCLVKWNHATHRVECCYRVQLAGDPLLGEGKPENQNHAIIFTRGECVQTIDMNQDGTFEDGLRMRNLMSEFLEHPFESGSDGFAIVGFPEEIFTQSLSSLAMYMGAMERTFVTLIGRSLYTPLTVRMHYGHPDVHDKLFAMQHGGVSRANRGINLNEDIFSAFNATLRGGKVAHREYVKAGKGRDVGFHQIYVFEAKLAGGAAEQLLSRDVYRLGRSLDFFRLSSMYYAGIAFYVNSALMGLTVFWFTYASLFAGVSSLDEQLKTFTGLCNTTQYRAPLASCKQLMDKSQLYVGAVQLTPMWLLGMLLTLPTFAEIALERGWAYSAKELLKHLVTGSPLFFMFHLMTKTHYFCTNLLFGGAQYGATGRGFVISHTSMGELFRLFAVSHFYNATDLTICLLFFKIFCLNGYLSNTILVWLILVTWFVAPIWFNPFAFDATKLSEDWREWKQWLSAIHRDENHTNSRRAAAAGKKSWRAWYRFRLRKLDKATKAQRFGAILAAAPHLIVALGCLCSLDSTTYSGDYAYLAIMVPFAVWLFTASVGAFVYTRYEMHLKSQRWDLCRCAMVVLSPLATVVWWTVLSQHAYGDQDRDPDVATQSEENRILDDLKVIVGFLYLCSFCSQCLTVCGARSGILQTSAKLYDTALGGLFFALLGLFTWLPGAASFQMRVLYNQAFSDGLGFMELLNPKLKNF